MNYYELILGHYHIPERFYSVNENASVLKRNKSFITKKHKERKLGSGKWLNKDQKTKLKEDITEIFSKKKITVEDMYSNFMETGVLPKIGGINPISLKTFERYATLAKKEMIMKHLEVKNG